MGANRSQPVPYSEFRRCALRFVERCGVSDGVLDLAAWEASGEPSIRSKRAQAFVLPPERRRVVEKTLEQRMAENDWAFASTPGGEESIEGGHCAVETLFFHGALDQLTEENKSCWVEYFNRYQDAETGYYLGPYIPPPDHWSWKHATACTHPWGHMHDHLASCLCPTLMLLGGRSRFPLSQGRQTGRFLDREYLRHFLWGRDWNEYQGDLNFRRHNPWWMGNEFWYPATLLWQISRWEAGTPEARQARLLLDEVWYDWHDRNFGVTGFWYGDLADDPARLWHGKLPSGSQPWPLRTPEDRHWAAYPVMGGAHQLWFYDFDRHPIPDAVRRAQTDTVLELQNRHHRHFTLGDIDRPAAWANNCTDVDGMTILAMNHKRQDYRRDDIERALHLALRAVFTDRISEEGVLVSIPGASSIHGFNACATYSPAGQASMLDQSFYLWAILAACSVVSKSDDPALQTYLDHPWPQVPSHWLWIPERRT